MDKATAFARECKYTQWCTTSAASSGQAGSGQTGSGQTGSGQAGSGDWVSRRRRSITCAHRIRCAHQMCPSPRGLYKADTVGMRGRQKNAKQHESLRTSNSNSGADFIAREHVPDCHCTGPVHDSVGRTGSARLGDRPEGGSAVPRELLCSLRCSLD